jgi:hypothetical protein
MGNGDYRPIEDDHGVSLAMANDHGVHKVIKRSSVVGGDESDSKSDTLVTDLSDSRRETMKVLGCSDEGELAGNWASHFSHLVVRTLRRQSELEFSNESITCRAAPELDSIATTSSALEPVGEMNHGDSTRPTRPTLSSSALGMSEHEPKVHGPTEA